MVIYRACKVRIAGGNGINIRSPVLENKGVRRVTRNGGRHINTVTINQDVALMVHKENQIARGVIDCPPRLRERNTTNAEGRRGAPSVHDSKGRGSHKQSRQQDSYSSHGITPA